MSAEAENIMDIFTKDEDLDPALVPYLRNTEFGQMLHHPLVTSMVMRPMYALLNRQFKARQEAIRQCLDEGRYDRYVFHHERPYRLDALLNISARLTSKKKLHRSYWRLVGGIWTDSENIAEQGDEWRRVWGADLADRHFVMNLRERRSLAVQPDVFPIWRGTSHPKGASGLSWTTDRDKAVWFAKRWQAKTPRIIEGSVNKKDVLARFLNRGENEIVVLPELVNDKTVTRL